MEIIAILKKQTIVNYLQSTIKGFLILSITALFIINTGCKDPYEFAPEPDTLIPPPNPPRLVYPPDDTGYVLTNIPGLDVVQIEFIWNAIIDAEYYEFHISSEPTFNDTLTRIYELSYNTLDSIFTRSSTGDHFWRVKASSPSWTWFTDWSEVRRFRIWYSGPAPY